MEVEYITQDKELIPLDKLNRGDLFTGKINDAVHMVVDIESEVMVQNKCAVVDLERGISKIIDGDILVTIVKAKLVVTELYSSL